MSVAVEQRDRELVIIRRVMRKWRRLSGIKDDPCACDGLGEGEFTANWTRVSGWIWSFGCGGFVLNSGLLISCYLHRPLLHDLKDGLQSCKPRAEMK